MRTADELRDAVEAYLGSLALAPELGALEQPLRYSLESGGKRVRPLLCLAVAEANGTSLEDAMPAAAALELVGALALEAMGHQPSPLRQWMLGRSGYFGERNAVILPGDDVSRVRDLHRSRVAVPLDLPAAMDFE